MKMFALYAALGVLWVTVLALHVSRVRIRERIGNGDGGNRALRKAIRSHMNAVEHVVPFGLVVLGLAVANVADVWIGALVAGMLGSRLLHAFGMLGSRFRLRQVAAGLTYVVEVVGCVVLLVAAFRM